MKSICLLLVLIAAVSAFESKFNLNCNNWNLLKSYETISQSSRNEGSSILTQMKFIYHTDYGISCKTFRIRFLIFPHSRWRLKREIRFSKRIIDSRHFLSFFLPIVFRRKAPPFFPSYLTCLSPFFAHFSLRLFFCSLIIFFLLFVFVSLSFDFSSGQWSFVFSCFAMFPYDFTSAQLVDNLCSYVSLLFSSLRQEGKWQPHHQRRWCWPRRVPMANLPPFRKIRTHLRRNPHRKRKNKNTIKYIYVQLKSIITFTTFIKMNSVSIRYTRNFKLDLSKF